MSVEVGALVFALSKKDSWKAGVVTAWNGKVGAVKCKDGDTLEKLAEDDMLQIDDSVLQEDVDDLLSLTLLHDSTLLHVLKERYMRDVIYTNIGAIVVALNPFNFKIPWYLDAKMPDYLCEGDRIEKNIPHSWAVAHNTFWELRNDEQNQTILVSGESGAGKTEASKIVMKYLAALSCRNGEQADKDAALEVGVKINMASPPLETYGNAKTVRNDNSSRFGKFMKVKFDSKGFLRGAHITKYLLEKSRIVTAAVGERVYHSFYLCVRGNEPKFKLGPDKSYRSLNAGKTLNNKEFDTAEEYHEVNASLAKMGVEANSIEQMWACCAGALHVLNLEYEAQGEGSKVAPATEHYMDKCCEQWAISKDTFLKEACKTEMSIGGQQVTKLLPPVKAVDNRDSLVKTLYDEEFSWLIETCNSLLDTTDQGNWIGLLDIFGFEDFEVNSFEQLCINLANESLQGHYNEYIFSRDMNMCRAEGIDVTEVVFPDNTPCLELVSGKGGLMAQLDEECSLGKGSDMGFLGKAEDKHKKNPFFLKKTLAKNSFIVHHYAGSVSYTVDGMLDKNRDTLKDAFKHMLRASTEPFIAALIPAPADGGKKLTVGGFFKQQVGMLMEVINSTNPHWIRCVKPHPAKKPLMFHGVTTMKQLSSSGVLGTVKIRKAGYPMRMSFLQFKQRYKIIAEGTGVDMADLHAVAGAIFKVAKFDNTRGQLGKSIVFMKSEGYVELEKLKKQCLAAFSKTLVAAALRRISQARLAAQRKVASVELIQGFCYSKPAERAWREKEYLTRKDAIIEACKKVIGCSMDEQKERERIIREEQEAVHQMLASLSDGFKKIEQEWLRTKPERDRRARGDVEEEEQRRRHAILQEEAEALKEFMALMSRDREAAEDRLFEREEEERMAEERAAAEERERLRLLEEARLAAEREAARIRLEEQRAVAIQAWEEGEREAAQRREERRREQAQRQDAIRARQVVSASADALRETERAHIIRTKAAYPEQRFDAGPGSYRPPSLQPAPGPRDPGLPPAGSPRSGAALSSPTAAASGRRSPSARRERSAPRSEFSDGGGSPSRRSVGGMSALEAAKARVASARLAPAETSSVDMVARLQQLRHGTSPGLIISPKLGLRDRRNPDNPANPNWKPPEDGMVQLPDGTRVSLEQFAEQQAERERREGRRRGRGGAKSPDGGA